MNMESWISAPWAAWFRKLFNKRVLTQKDNIASGKTKVFVGPIKDQSGKLRIAKGSAAEDKDLLGMTWFVEGVVGTTQ